MASTESIGLSGLLTSQRLLDLTGQNIANAQTPGYHRQVATLAVRTAGQQGLGVEILEIRRQIDTSLEDAIVRSTFATHDLAAQLDALRQVETQLNPGDGSVHDLLGQFFSQLDQLAGHPDDITQRRVVLNTASALADKLNGLLSAVQEQFTGLQQQITDRVDRINDLAGRIAVLNAAVERNTIQGGNPNDLSDQRDQLIGQLAELIDVRTAAQPHGSVNVITGGVPLVLGNQHLTLHAGIDKNNRSFIAAEGLDVQLSVVGGELHGLMALRNDSLAGVVDGLKNLTRTLVNAIDSVQATGLGLSGPFGILHGQRAVSNVNLPLDQAGLLYPPRAGSLFVTVTDLTTGARTLHEVAIDPATQSLQDVAAALSGVPHLQALVDPQTRGLTMVAQSGYAFDFAGRLATAPQSVAISGTAVPKVGGLYTGANNDNFTFTVVGNGTVGVTPNLMLEARNSSGALVGSWNIGQGYEPGSDLAAFQGITVRLSSGTVNNGDSFTSRAIAQSDTAGLLPALGLNSFFEGDFGNLRVRADLLAAPERLSGSSSGLPADGANFRLMASVRDLRLLANGQNTLEQFYGQLAADVGSRVQDLEDRHAAQESLGRGLEAERQSISGVDPNEELLRLVQYQRSFQLSSRFLTVVNDTLADLLRLV